MNGKTDREAKIVHSFITLDEILLTSFFKADVYHGGSHGEATFEKGSDVDMMTVESKILVVESADFKCLKDTSGHVFLMVRNKCSPVYVYLRPLKLDGNDPYLHILLDIGDRGCTLASSENFVNYVVEIMQSKLNGMNIYNYFRNGPCASCVYMPMFNRRICDTDLAHAIKCTSWPNDSKEWFNRSRQNGWPTKEMLNKIRHLDCHVVGTGNRLSPFRNLEWRLSFILAERELVRSFNEMQFKCYSLLKTILRSKIAISFPDSISSYHIKTTLFWTIEESPKTVWTSKNLVNCVRICLERMSESVRLKTLFHYILRKQNLFEHILIDPTISRRLYQELQKYAKNPIHLILRYAEMGGLDKIMEQFGKEFMMKMCSLSGLIDLNIEEIVKKRQILQTLEQSFHFFHRMLIFSMGNFEVINRQLKNNKDLDEEFKIRVQMFLLLKTGLDEQRLAAESSESAKKAMHQDKALDAFQRGCNADAVTGHLYLANNHIMTGNYETAKSILIGIFSQDVGVVYFGLCSEYRYFNTKPVMRCTLLNYLTSNLGHRSQLGCGDILFRMDDIKSVPYAVQFECALSESYNISTCISIHPLVYVHFLSVIAYHHLGMNKDSQDAIRNLEHSVNMTQGGFYRHRAFNLLAHAHLFVGRRNDAVKHLIQSATLFPNPKNAALYIIAILLLQTLTGEEINSRT